MPQITFIAHTLTPLFISGADQTTAELRPPTFRGLMRYWYRALTGSLVGTDTNGLTTVIEAETALFGANDTGSAVSIRVSEPSTTPREFTEKISIPQGGKWQATGKGYLLWSMAKSGKAERGNLKPARWYFPSNTSFQVTLSTRGNNGTKLRQAEAAFWLLTHLGSVGSRSRRCAGSITVQPVHPGSTTFPFDLPEDAQALKLQIEQGIKDARAFCHLNYRSVKDARFDVLTPDACHIWILQDEQPWSNPEIAMKEIGERLQDYRRMIPIHQRKIFGLPLQTFNGRRASPLLLRIAELRNNKYVGIAVLFKTMGSGICMEDYTIFDKWPDEFEGTLEVAL